MRTCKPAAGLLKGEQWRGWLEGVQLMRLEDSSRKLGDNCLTYPRLVHLFLSFHGAPLLKKYF
jgi:hypothetical protein